MLDNYHRLNATVSDLIMGNTYSFRVFSQNKVGTSEASAVTKGVASIQKTGDPLQNIASSHFVEPRKSVGAWHLQGGRFLVINEVW